MRVHAESSRLLSRSSGILIGFIALAACAPPPHAYAAPAPTPDFFTEVQTGMQQAAQNASVSAAITGQDTVTAWDEFGSNALISGAAPASMVAAGIAADISNDIARTVRYDQEEVRYLSARDTSPEQVQAAEDGSGSDVPPGESIVPNPSLDANPTVAASNVEDIGPIQTIDAANATQSNDITAIENADTSAATGVSDVPGTDAAIDTASANDANPLPTTDLTPADAAVLESVINQSVPPPGSGDTTGVDANMATDASSADAGTSGSGSTADASGSAAGDSGSAGT